MGKQIRYTLYILAFIWLFSEIGEKETPKERLRRIRSERTVKDAAEIYRETAPLRERETLEYMRKEQRRLEKKYGK